MKDSTKKLHSNCEGIFNGRESNDITEGSDLVKQAVSKALKSLLSKGYVTNITILSMLLSLT